MGYPLVIDVSEKLVVLVGGGHVATRRARRLLDAGARLRIVSPEVTVEMREFISAGRADWKSRSYRKEDIVKAALVIAATDRAKINRAIAADARASGILVNVVDRHTDGDVLVPAVAQFGPLRLTIDTGGAGPALSAALRRHLEATLSPGWQRAAAVMARLRPLLVEVQGQEVQDQKVQDQKVQDQKVRRGFWRDLAAELPGGFTGEPDDVVALIEVTAQRSGLDLSAIDLNALVADALSSA